MAGEAPHQLWFWLSPLSPWLWPDWGLWLASLGCDRDRDAAGSGCGLGLGLGRLLLLLLLLLLLNLWYRALCSTGAPV